MNGAVILCASVVGVLALCGYRAACAGAGRWLTLHQWFGHESPFNNSESEEPFRGEPSMSQYATGADYEAAMKKVRHEQ